MAPATRELWQVLNIMRYAPPCAMPFAPDLAGSHEMHVGTLTGL
ncbi:MAG: hypothetical protein R6V27_05425 [Balneolaceae bacterium]